MSPKKRIAGIEVRKMGEVVLNHVRGLSSCCSDWTPGLGASVCLRCGSKKKKKNSQNKKKHIKDYRLLFQKKSKWTLAEPFSREQVNKLTWWHPHAISSTCPSQWEGKSCFGPVLRELGKNKGLAKMTEPKGQSETTKTKLRPGMDLPHTWKSPSWRRRSHIPLLQTRNSRSVGRKKSPGPLHLPNNIFLSTISLKKKR